MYKLLRILILLSIIPSCTGIKEKETEVNVKNIVRDDEVISGIVGVESQNGQKGTGFIIGYNEANNIVHIITEYHVIPSFQCSRGCKRTSPFRFWTT